MIRDVRGLLEDIIVTVLCTTCRHKFETVVHEHQSVAYEQVEIAAALGTSRAVEQLPSCFRDIENNAESEFQSSISRLIVRHYFRVKLSHSELSDTICFKKAAAEMMRRDTRNPEVVYQLRK